MKRAVFISLFFFVSLLSFGQSRLFDRNDTIDITTATCAGLGNNHSWLVGGSMHYCFNEGLLNIADTGNGKWTVVGLTGIINNIHLQDGNLYSTGDFIDHSDVEPGYGAFVIKYDSLGSVVDWHSYISDTPTRYIDSVATGKYSLGQNLRHGKPHRSTLIDTNSILISSGNFVSCIDLHNWQVLWTKSYQGSGIINDVSRDVNGYIFLACDSARMVIDTSGSVLHAVYSVIPAQQCYETNTGNIYFTTDSLIIKTDTSLNISGQISRMPTFFQWNGLTGTDRSIYIAGVNSRDSIKLLVMDTNLAVINIISIDGVCTLPTAMAARDSLVLVTGGEGEVYYRTYTNTGNSRLSQSKLVLSSIHINSQQVVDLSTYYAVNSDLSFTLINAGNDTIHSFKIRNDDASMPGENYCFGPHFVLDTSGINLLPNDTMTINILSFLYVPNTGLTVTIPYILSSVNGARPTEECGLPLINEIVTGINEITSSPFHIYPNPTSNILNIQTSSDVASNTTFHLSDLTGRVLMQKNISQGTNQIDISTFTPGLYIYTIKDGVHNPLTGKIEKL